MIPLRQVVITLVVVCGGAIGLGFLADAFGVKGGRSNAEADRFNAEAVECSKRKDFRCAIERAERAATLVPGNAQFRANYGAALAAGGHGETAVQELRVALSIDPNNKTALDWLAFTNVPPTTTLATGPYADILNEAANGALASRPVTNAVSDGPSLLARAYETLSSSAKAERLNSEGRDCLAALNKRCAIEKLGAAVRLAPDNGKYRYNLGLALARSGAYQQAIDELKIVVAADPGDMDARRALGRVQDALDGQRAAEIADSLRD